MPHAFRILAFACAGVLAPVVQAGDLVTYALDPVHTRIVFTVEHAGFSRAMGTISGSTGTLRFDRDDWRSAQLEVTVPLERLDLGDTKWNAATLAANLLDAKRHPAAHFVSTRVEPADADHARVCGELTLRGVTRPLCMDVTLNALKRHPLPPFRRTAGFSATATLSRREFGIEAWPTVIGDQVGLLIEAEAVRSRQGPMASGPSPAQEPPLAEPDRPEADPSEAEPIIESERESEDPEPVSIEPEPVTPPRDPR